MIILSQKENLSDKVVGWIARTEPPTNAHLKYIMKLTKIYKKVIIISGSYFSLGNSRHCIPAITRIKMIKSMLKDEKVPEDKYEIVPLADYNDDQMWLDDLLQIVRNHNIDDIATGNEWVQNIVSKYASLNNSSLRVGDIPLDEKIPYRATDVRKAIEIGDYKSLKNMVPKSVLEIMCSYEAFKNIELANTNQEVNFVPGRQTVDMVFLLKDKKTDKLYVLLGNRPDDAIDFAGMLALPGSAIEKFELVEDACVRSFKEETGIDIEILEDSFVSTPVTIKNITSELLSMKLVGIYSSENVKKMGTRGGSSQCFTIFVEGDVNEYRKILNPTKGLKDVDFFEVDSVLDSPLAFQHNEMLQRAVYMSKAKVKWEKDTMERYKNSKCIYFVGGPGSGKSTAAYGTMFILKLLGISCEITGEFAKDKVYEGSLRSVLKSQAKIIGEQDFRVARLNGAVDYIISDAPLIISAMHARDEKPLEESAYYLFGKTDNYTIFIDRDKNVEFETKARLEDEKKADEISTYLKDSLDQKGYDYTETKGSINAVKEAIKFVVNDNPELKGRAKDILKNVENIMLMLGGLNNV